MKRLFIILSVLAMGLMVFPGCGGEKKATSNAEDKTAAPATQTGKTPPSMPNIEVGSPQAAYKDMADAVAAFDANKLYGLLSTPAKTQLDGLFNNLKKEKSFASSPYSQTKNGQELLTKQFEIYKNEGAKGIEVIYKDQGFLATALSTCKVEGEKASISEPNGGTVLLIKESGAWKVDFPADTLLQVPPPPKGQEKK